MISKGLVFFIITSLLLAKTTFAQEDKNTFTTTVKHHYGVVVSHHESIAYAVEKTIGAIELNFGLIPSSKPKWTQLYNQPEIGLAVYHGDLGNDRVFGKVTALFPYINFNLLRDKKLNIVHHLGLGLAVTEKHFDPIKNYTNVAIGSSLNVYISLSLNAELSLNSKWQLIGGLGINHLSNGSFKKPNTGLNLLTANFGLKYAFKERPKNLHLNKINHFKDLDNEFSIAYNQGLKQIKESEQQTYYMSSITANYAWGINAKQRLGLGLDLFYDRSSNRGTWDFKPKTNFEDRFRQGIFISHDLFINNLAIVTQIGVYTYYKTKPEEIIYTRLGLKYNIGQHFFANINLKAHGGKADYVEWGFGYRIQKKKKD